MDSDIILVRPVDSVALNTVAWHNTTMSTAFMNFQKGSSFLKSHLEMFSDSDLFTTDSSDLDSTIREAARLQNVHGVKFLGSSAFDLLHGKDIANHCITGSDLSFMKSYQKQAYGVQLNTLADVNITKLKQKTLCKHLLNLFCILCNKQY